MNWYRLTAQEELDGLVRRSHQLPQIIFKHSPRCSISSVAFNRLQSGIEKVDFHLLDVISSRNLSNLVEEQFNVVHQSPQLLIISKGRSVFDTSHFGITSNVVNNQLKLLTGI